MDKGVNKQITYKSDYIGASASFLCMIHCLSTPLLFVAKACSISCCADTPLWWKSIDYLFLLVSFGAIYYSSKESSNKSVKTALWIAWNLLVLSTINESLEFVKTIKYLNYAPALLLVGLHIYNQKYCKCSSSECCASPSSLTNE